MVGSDVAWPQFFGRTHLGSIRGVGTALGIVGAALGPLPFGFAYDLTGDYRAAIGILLILPVVAAIVMWLAKPPRKREAPEELVPEA